MTFDAAFSSKETHSSRILVRSFRNVREPSAHNNRCRLSSGGEFYAAVLMPRGRKRRAKPIRETGRLGIGRLIFNKPAFGNFESGLLT